MPASRALQVPRHNDRRAVPRDRLLYPLDLLYERAGVAPPIAKRVAAEHIPSPYSDLLVHQNEMTSTLEGHFGGPLAVRVLSSFTKRDAYFRRVLLTLQQSARPVAMGAVRIRLDVFSPAVRARILSQSPRRLLACVRVIAKIWQPQGFLKASTVSVRIRAHSPAS